jgi:hypothetical protein
MSTLDRYSPDFQRLGDGAYRGWKELNATVDSILAKIGKPTLGFVDVVGGTPQSNPTASTNAPEAAQFAVVGLDGKFLLQIQNPQNVLPQSANLVSAYALAGLNAPATPILHNVQSSTTTDFDLAHGLTDYGISPQLGYTFQNPNATLFWRLRSSYDGKTWNKWQIYSSVLTCGPVGVWSGLQRSLADVILNVASTILGTSILAQSGTTTRINVAATQLVTGGQTIQYGSGFVDPGAYGKYFVYWIDLLRQGGTPTFLATLNASDLTSQDGVVSAGNPITTSSGGGGGGGGGGGNGGCCVGESRIDMPDGSVKCLRELRRGMKIRNPLGQSEEITRIDLIPGMPCFTARLESGELLQGFSPSHGFKYAGAGIVSGFDLLPGELIAGHGLVPKRVVGKSFLGARTVHRIELAGPTKLYVADGAVGHNFNKP